VPETGYCLGEVDWSQIEVGVAAAVYHDEKLTEKFNTGDVYSAMAQEFYQKEISETDLSLPGAEFKRKHSKLRNQMKTCTLGIIYGLTPHGLANYLNIPKFEAAQLQKRFIAMFPDLKRGLVEAQAFGAIRGYANTITGLRRYRSSIGEATNWEKNWLTNHPVQGTAADLFKVAGTRLDRIYRQYDAKIIIPFHDAFVFEAPAESFEEVAKITDRVMCDTVREFFPELYPKTEANNVRPDCWNKDGDAESLVRWLADPLAEVGGL
jgi:DNA polymerase-1